MLLGFEVLMGHGHGQIKVKLKVTALTQVFDSMGELDGDVESDCCLRQERDARSEPLMRLTPIRH